MLADLALVGFGNVGRRFVRLLDERRAELQREFDLTWRVTGIATRRHGSIYNASGIDASAAAQLVEAGTAAHDGWRVGLRAVTKSSIGWRASAAPLRVLLETTTLDIAAGRPARDHVRRARCSSAATSQRRTRDRPHSLTSELSDVARENGVRFLFEGAVMDGIPIFNLVRETMPTVRVEGFRGVVNSTTNHILTALEDGAEYGPALAEMQAQGIAEADPSLDVDGWDAAAKAAALTNVLLDGRITPHDVDRTGIGAGHVGLGTRRQGAARACPPRRLGASRRPPGRQADGTAGSRHPRQPAWHGQCPHPRHRHAWARRRLTARRRSHADRVRAPERSHRDQEEHGRTGRPAV